MILGGPDQRVFRLLAVQGVLEDLPRLEGGDVGRGDFDCLTRARIPSGARRALFHLKGAKAGELDLVSLTEYINDDPVAIEQGFDSAGRIGLSKVGLVGNCFNEFCFVHDSPGKWVSR